jgi:hypothetical protein
MEQLTMSTLLLRNVWAGLGGAALLIASLWAVPVAAQTTTLTASPVKHASASSSADGVWSVLIITEKGTCDRGYRYPIRIVRGKVGHLNPSSSFNINGRVSPGGGVFVKISRGDQSASGSGRIGGSSGSGKWKTASGECSGIWTAERRT